MDTTTLGGAVTQVARNMGLTNGEGMTPYSNDAVIAYLISAHELIRTDKEWAELTVWRERVLDGTTGKITELITDTKDWKRIKRIYHESMQTPLAYLSSYTNPIGTMNSLLFGYRGIAPEEDNSATAGRYLVKFYPATLTGNVLFQITREIDFTNMDTVLPVDWWWHVYLASWVWANDDGTNPAQAVMYEKLIRTRKSQITAEENSRPVWLQPNQLIPNDWWEQDAPYS